MSSYRLPRFSLPMERVSLSSLRRYVLLAGQILITLSLVFTLLFLFEWNQIGEQLASVQLNYLTAGVVCITGVLILGALNIWILLNGFTQISFRTTLRFYLLSWCSFLLVPGSAGDAIQIVFLKEAGVPYRDGWAVYVTDKQVTLFLTMLVAVTGGMIYFRPYFRPWALVGVAALMGLVTIAAYVLARKSNNVWVSRLLSLLCAPVLFWKIHPGRVGMNAMGTLIKLLLTALSHWLTFRAIGAELDVGLVFTVAIVAGLVAYFPVAFNGVGTVELAALTLYGQKDVPAYQVLATYLILRTGVFLLAFAGFVFSRLLASKPAVTLLQE